MRIFFAFVLALAACLAVAQPHDPVQWSARWSAPITKKGQKVFLIVTAKIEPKWHIYAAKSGEGIFSTQVSVAPATKLFLSTGDWVLPESVTVDDPAAGKPVNVYENEVEFKLPVVIVKFSKQSVVTISTTHQACSGEMCLRPVRSKLSLKCGAVPPVAPASKKS